MQKELGLLSLLLAGSISAATVDFTTKETVIGTSNDALSFVETNECISPLYADWDGDGVKDLLLGYWKGQKGFVRYYRNEGSDAVPSYSGWEHLTHSGGEVSAAGG